MGLGQQLGSKEYGRERDFRQKLANWLREVKAWWPECPCGRVAGWPVSHYFSSQNLTGNRRRDWRVLYETAGVSSRLARSQISLYCGGRYARVSTQNQQTILIP